MGGSSADCSAELLSTYLAAAVEATWRGAAVLEDWRKRFRVQEKARFDLVTDADLASQQVIRDYLHERFPGHGFLGEEDKTAQARPAPHAPPTWIVDPLDGTTNYVHDNPCYAVSIGLQMAAELVIGVILDPSRRELFKAAKGMGAWLGEERLATSRVETLEQALICTGFPSNMRGRDELLEWWRYFGLRTQALRRTGSTALNLAYVAAGRFDAYYTFDNHAWDVGAGVVLVREAGGVVTNLDGSSFDPFTPDGLAANEPLHAAMLGAFRAGPR